MLKRSLLLLLCMVPLTTVSADVFKYKDANGQILLTDRPVGGSQYQLVKRFSLKGVRSHTRGDTLAAMLRRRENLHPAIEHAATQNELAPELVHAVVRVESAYRADAVSSKGAMGLMQLMPATAERLGVSDAYDPKQNLAGGTRYLRDLLRMFDDDLQLALAAYNAGENAVIKYGRQIPPYTETQDYVKKVLEFYQQHLAEGPLAQR